MLRPRDGRYVRLTDFALTISTRAKCSASGPTRKPGPSRSRPRIQIAADPIPSWHFKTPPWRSRATNVTASRFWRLRRRSLSSSRSPLWSRFQCRAGMGHQSVARGSSRERLASPSGARSPWRRPLPWVWFSASQPDRIPRTPARRRMVLESYLPTRAIRHLSQWVSAPRDAPHAADTFECCAARSTNRRKPSACFPARDRFDDPVVTAIDLHQHRLPRGM